MVLVERGKKEYMETLVVMAVDDNYAKYAAVTITSIISNRGKKNQYRICILHVGLKKNNIKQLEKLCCMGCQVECINISTAIQKCNPRFVEKSHFSEATYYRLLIPEIFSEYETLVYLDSDLIVNVDIADIIPQDLGNNLIAAAKDPYFKAHKGKLTCLNLSASEYVNSGVLVINNKLWVKERIAQKCFDLLEETPPEHLDFADQDIINMACKGRIYYLNSRWNYMWHFINGKEELRMVYAEAVKEAADGINIIHYSSSRKPWNVNRPLAEYWWRYAESTEMYRKSCRAVKKRKNEIESLMPISRRTYLKQKNETNKALKKLNKEIIKLKKENAFLREQIDDIKDVFYR